MVSPAKVGVFTLALVGLCACGPDRSDCRILKTCDLSSSSSVGGADGSGGGGAMTSVGAGGHGGGTETANPQAISAGWHHTCAVVAGDVWCWGRNDDGQLGDGTSSPAASPVRVAGLTTQQVAVSAGNRHTCSLDVEGDVRCWGYNEFGQLGNGTKTSSLVPVQAAVDTVVSLSAGENATAAIRQGSLMLWGKFAHEFIGSNETIYFSAVEPGQVLTDVAHVANAGDHLCYLQTGQGLRCLGVNSDVGQLGDGSFVSGMTPVVPTGLPSARATATFYRYSCAADLSGRVHCWGQNSDNSILGNGGQDASEPQLFPSELADVVELCAGEAFGCARLGGGAVKCWGRNTNGQHGNGMTGVASGVNTVAGILNAQSLTCGSSHACVVTTDHRVLCWGDGVDGQVGWGSYMSSNTPVPVEERW